MPRSSSMHLIIGILLSLLQALPAVAEETIRGRLLGFETYTVSGENMSPTIHRDELVYVETKVIGPAGPKRGDIVAYRSEKLNGAILVMRAVAIGGDSVELRDGQLIVNEKAVDESYVDRSRAQQPFSKRFGKTIVRAGAIFVLGDCRDNSNDSRFLGPVPVTAVIGLVTGARKSWLQGEFRKIR